MKSPAKSMVSVMIALGLIAACPAAGQNQFGLFFDTGGNVICTTAAFLSHVPMYVLYLDPDPQEVSGCDLAIRADMGGNPPLVCNSQFSFSSPTGTVLGDGAMDQIAVRWDPPLPCTSVTMMLCVDIFYLDFYPIAFAIDGPASPAFPLTGPYVILPDGSGLEVGEAINSNPDYMCYINSPFACASPNEPTEWGTIKCLYRD